MVAAPRAFAANTSNHRRRILCRRSRNNRNNRRNNRNNRRNSRNNRRNSRKGIRSG